MKNTPLYVPTTVANVGKRSAGRIAFCAVPYLVITWLLTGARPFDSIGFFWCVVLIPAGGLALDLWRLCETARSVKAPMTNHE